MRAEDVSPREALAARARIAPLVASSGDRVRAELIELGALLICSYPAFGPLIDAHPEDLLALARGTRQARDLRAYRRLAASAVGDLSDGARVRRGLRRWTAREKLRIAARELLAHPGHDVDVTSRELADLADVCCEIALAEAQAWAEARFGTPIASNGASCAFSVIGMGKLGGRELNAGSDIDLMLFYETDDGFVVPPSPSVGAHTLHEHFTRVAQRFVATLDEATEDGVVWRVDLRLRPEGTRGPLVNALAATERYYETWGRTWERAALVRARPVAGDPAFGERLLGALAPFVWRRAVNPSVVDEMGAMLGRARAEAGIGVDDDLKIGQGGIREVEFFAQSLQLVWGGREPRVRGANTVEALRRLRARGFVTEREERELSDAYYFLRRLEHRVQFATGQQTHSIPRDPAMVERIARSLGYDGADPLLREAYRVRAGVGRAIRVARADRGPLVRARARPPVGRPRRARRGRDRGGGGRALRPGRVQRPAAAPARALAAAAQSSRRQHPRSRSGVRAAPGRGAGRRGGRGAGHAAACGVLRALRDPRSVRSGAGGRPLPGERRLLAPRRQQLPGRDARGASRHGRSRSSSRAASPVRSSLARRSTRRSPR